MRRLTAVAAGILVGAAGLAGGRALGALQEKPAPCTPAAFVNVNRVLQGYPRAKKLVDDLTRDGEALKKSLTDRGQELRNRAKDLDLKLDPGTPEYEKEKRDIQLLMAAVQYDEKSGLDAIVRRQVTGLAAVYKEICAAAEGVATAKGYSFVFTLDTDPPTVQDDKGQLLSINELKLQMALRTTLWAKPELDITQDVVAALAK